MSCSTSVFRTAVTILVPDSCKFYSKCCNDGLKVFKSASLLLGRNSRRSYSVLSNFHLPTSSLGTTALASNSGFSVLRRLLQSRIIIMPGPRGRKASFPYCAVGAAISDKVNEEAIDPIQRQLLDEECILLDRNDHVIGRDSKRNCHLIQPNGDIKLHRAFSVFIFNSQGGFAEFVIYFCNMREN